MAKIITMEGLYEYFEKRGKSIHFNSEEADHELFVKTDGRIKFETSDDSGLLKVILQSCHIGKNLNGSSISYEAMQEALPSFYSKPILGYIHEVDGQYEFKSHEMHIDKNGKTVYDEIPVGVITSQGGLIEHDYEKNKDYAVVSGVIWEEYTKAAEILKRDKKAACSVELKIIDLSYDANEKLLLINSFLFNGVTILGKDEYGNNVMPGMDGANIAIIDEQFATSDGESVPTEFSDNKNSEERRTTNMATHGLPEGEKNAAPEEIDQKTTFDDGVDGTSDASGDSSDTPEGDAGDANVDPDVSNQDDTTLDNTGDSASSNDGSVDENNTEEPGQNEQNDNNDEPVAEPDLVVEPVVNEPAPLAAAPAAASSESATSVESEEASSSDGEVKKRLMSIGDMSFELSLTEKAWAIEDLVNATYGFEDNDYYMCKVYESYVIMNPWIGAQSYRQNYAEESEGVFTLVGEREKVFVEYLTESEKDALNMMRSTYAELKRYKEESEMAKIEAEKSKLFASFDAKLVGVQEYEDLKKNREKYTVSELELRCNAIVGKQTMKFAAEESAQKNTIQLNFSADRNTQKKKPYGALFDKK